VCIALEAATCDCVELQKHFRLPRRIEFLADAAMGLAHIHKCGYLHRDMKPSNILVVWEGGRHVGKLCDFGSCVKIGTDVSMKGTTHRYSPPEFTSTPADDVFSFAITMWEIVTLEGAYGFDTKAEDIPAMVKQGKRPEQTLGLSDDTSLQFHGLDEIITQCWDQDPTKRLSMDDVAQRLNDIVMKLDVWTHLATQCPAAACATTQDFRKMNSEDLHASVSQWSAAVDPPSSESWSDVATSLSLDPTCNPLSVVWEMAAGENVFRDLVPNLRLGAPPAATPLVHFVKHALQHPPPETRIQTKNHLWWCGGVLDLAIVEVLFKLKPTKKDVGTLCVAGVVVLTPERAVVQTGEVNVLFSFTVPSDFPLIVHPQQDRACLLPGTQLLVTDVNILPNCTPVFSLLVTSPPS